MKRALPLLLILMVLWVQALPGVRCLHTGNVLPITILLTTSAYCCCHADCDSSVGVSSSTVRGYSCYVDAPSDTSSIWSKLKIADVQTVLVLISLHFAERSPKIWRPIITAESRAPPWMARLSQLSYLTYRSLLI